MNVPIIRLEVEGMKYSISTALTEHQAKMDAGIQAAVEAYCTTENIDRVIRQYATAALDGVIKAEVDSFFRYGAGKHAVAEAVKESILSKKTFTLLDNVD